MPTWTLILIIVLGVLILVFIGLLIFSKKAEKKQEAQEADIKKQAMPMNLYIIDKQKMHIKDANLPKVVYENTPKLGRISKVPIVKVKAANQVLSMMCDPQVYKTLLPKQEVKAQVAGLYIVSAKRLRGPQVEGNGKKAKKESILDKLR